MPLNRWHLYIGLLVLLLCAAGARFLFHAPAPATSDMFERVYYRCANGHELTFTRQDILKHYREHYGEPLTCPKCGSEDLTLCERDPKTGRFKALPLRPEQPPASLR